jgi:uracil-DNA glycosylase family 4
MITNEDLKSKVKTICENYSSLPIGGWITGDGPIPSELLFVGEAPGKTEVALGKPFIGMAGKTFEYYLNIIGYEKDNIRITNTCYFRPVKITTLLNGKTSTSNRTPKPSEVALFKEVLDSEILITNPKIIITLGNISLKRLTSFTSIGTCHGELYFNKDLSRYIFPMYHPSALTYNRNEEFLKMYEEDWNKLKKAIETI